jgi:hypothetical protein
MAAIHARALTRSILPFVLSGALLLPFGSTASAQSDVDPTIFASPAQAFTSNGFTAAFERVEDNATAASDPWFVRFSPKAAADLAAQGRETGYGASLVCAIPDCSGLRYTYYASIYSTSGQAATAFRKLQTDWAAAGGQETPIDSAGDPGLADTDIGMQSSGGQQTVLVEEFFVRGRILGEVFLSATPADLQAAGIDTAVLVLLSTGVAIDTIAQTVPTAPAATATNTPTPSATPTSTPTQTPTPTPTVMPTATATSTPTLTPTPTATATEQPPALTISVRGTLRVNHSGTLRVVVSDARETADLPQQMNVPLAGARVVIDGRAAGIARVRKATTDARGMAVFKSLRPTRAGTVIIRASLAGYPSVAKRVKARP